MIIIEYMAVVRIYSDDFGALPGSNGDKSISWDDSLYEIDTKGLSSNCITN